MRIIFYFLKGLKVTIFPDQLNTRRLIVCIGSNGGSIPEKCDANDATDSPMIRQNIHFGMNNSRNIHSVLRCLTFCLTLFGHGKTGFPQ